jgi:hypothetical protein
MVERGERPGLTLEPGEPLLIADEGVEDELERDLAPELGIARAIDLAHSPCTELADDFVVTEAGSRVERHGRGQRESNPGSIGRMPSGSEAGIQHGWLVTFDPEEDAPPSRFPIRPPPRSAAAASRYCRTPR